MVCRFGKQHHSNYFNYHLTKIITDAQSYSLKQETNRQPRDTFLLEGKDRRYSRNNYKDLLLDFVPIKCKSCLLYTTCLGYS